MENEKSVYEMRLEEKDKIINSQQKLIVLLIKIIVLISFLILSGINFYLIFNFIRILESI